MMTKLAMALILLVMIGWWFVTRGGRSFGDWLFGGVTR